MGASGAQRQRDYRKRLKNKAETKQVAVFVPDWVAEKLGGKPDKLVNFFIEAEERLNEEIKAHRAWLRQASAAQVFGANLSKDEILAECRLMGISATFGRARMEEIIYEDIPDLQARRDELKNAVKLRTEEWMSLETEIVENRLEADRWQGLLDEICEMLAGSHAPEAIWTVIGIETVKNRLRTITGRNREISAPSIQAVRARLRTRKKARQRPPVGGTHRRGRRP
jgi:hypothetical protein